MKLSVSLVEEDVAFIDEYAKAHEAPSRSAVLHEAVDLLRASQLSDAYAAAWQEWESSGVAEDWDATAGDGLSGADDRVDDRADD
ncbi:MAG TPA: antitoxin [Pseudonocardiaceae bacterium]|jgi:Arc/MetJ-type ribon-helix-helix transcriptional regulator|nr:antitoxin [Pseudonocardiaceae bacterium]